MRTLFILLVLLVSAKASPFLVCDFYPAGLDQFTKPVSFILTGLSASSINTPATINQDGTVQLKYDLGSLPHGTYTVTASAVNVLGGISGASVPFNFVSGVPADPNNLHIVP